MYRYVKHFTANPAGRDFVVGDVHGCFEQLSAALEEQRFDGNVDRLFSVGDLVDRGPQSAAVMDWLARPWFHAVRGNHEQMALDYLAGELDPDDYQYNGGSWFFDLGDTQQAQIAARFSMLPVALEVETPSGLVGIVHADCPFASWTELVRALDTVDAELIAEICMSSRERFIAADGRGVTDVAKVIVGHTPVGVPYTLGNVHYVDTGAVYGNHLTLRQFN